MGQYYGPKQRIKSRLKGRRPAPKPKFRKPSKADLRKIADLTTWIADHIDGIQSVLGEARKLALGEIKTQRGLIKQYRKQHREAWNKASQNATFAAMYTSSQNAYSHAVDAGEETIRDLQDFLEFQLAPAIQGVDIAIRRFKQLPPTYRTPEDIEEAVRVVTLVWTELEEARQKDSPVGNSFETAFAGANPQYWKEVRKFWVRLTRRYENYFGS